MDKPNAATDMMFAATFLWMVRLRNARHKEDQPDVDYFLDRIWATLPPHVRRKIAAAFTGAAYKEIPHEVPLEAVLSERTLKELAKHPIGPLFLSPNPWEMLEGVHELMGVLESLAPGEERPSIPTANEWFMEGIVRVSHEFDPQVVRRAKYEFQAEIARIAKCLGHPNVEAFFRWLDTKHGKAEMRKTLQACQDSIRAELSDLQEEHLEPISARRMRWSYENGRFGQHPLRVKLWHFAKAKGVPRLADLEIFLQPSYKFDNILRDLRDADND